jgi:hypothetical protein
VCAASDAGERVFESVDFVTLGLENANQRYSVQLMT